MVVFEEDTDRGKVKVHCEKKEEEGTAFCRIEEIDGEGWAEIQKAPNERGEWVTVDVEGEPSWTLDEVKEQAKKHLSDARPSLR